MFKKAIAIVTTVFLVSSCNMNFVNNNIPETQGNINLKGFSIKSTTNPNDVKKSFLSKTRISKGKEDESKKTFKFEVTQADLSRNFVLNMFNGPDGTNRVANIEVKVNGKPIIFKHDEDLNDIEDINKIKNKLCENNEKDDDKKFSTKSEKDDDDVKIKDCSLLLQNFFNRKTESLSARMWGIKAGNNVLEVKVKDEKKNFALDVSIDGFLDPINIPNSIDSKMDMSEGIKLIPTVKGKLGIKFTEGMKVDIIKDTLGNLKLVDLNGTYLSGLERIFKLNKITNIHKFLEKMNIEEIDNLEKEMESNLNKEVPNGNLFCNIKFDENIDVWQLRDEIKKLPYIEEVFPDFELTNASCSLPNDPASTDITDGRQYGWLDITRISDNISRSSTYNYIPSTTDDSLWGAWRYGRGNKDVGVAVLDSWFEHPSMGNYKNGLPVLLHEDLDLSNIEFVNNVFLPDKPRSVADLFHGTGAAGIIGAKANNNTGMAGITDAKMLLVKAIQTAHDPDIPYKDTSNFEQDLHYFETGYNSLYDSLYMLLDKKYDWIKVVLIEMQYGVIQKNSKNEDVGIKGTGKTVELDPSFRWVISALVNKGKVVVVPAGNDYETNIKERIIEIGFLGPSLNFIKIPIKIPFPDTGSIIVGGLNWKSHELELMKSTLDQSVYYNYGKTNFDSNGVMFNGEGHGIDVCAPASDVYSTGTAPEYLQVNDINRLLNKKLPYFRFSGTSAGSPIIAGICQLMFSIDPSLKPERIRQILRITTNEKNLGITTPDGTKTTAGMVNAYEAVKMANGGRKPEPACSKINITGQPDSITYNTKSIPVVTNGAKIEVKAGDQIAIPITPSIKNQLNNVYIGGIQLTLLQIVQNYAIYGVPNLGASSFTATTNLIDIVIKNNLGQTVETLADALKILLDAITTNCNNVSIEVFDIDDLATVSINSNNFQFGYGRTVNTLSASPYLKSGANNINFSLYNDRLGYAYGFRLLNDGQIIYEASKLTNGWGTIPDYTTGTVYNHTEVVNCP